MQTCHGKCAIWPLIISKGTISSILKCNGQCNPALENGLFIQWYQEDPYQFKLNKYNCYFYSMFRNVDADKIDVIYYKAF